MRQRAGQACRSSDPRTSSRTLATVAAAAGRRPTRPDRAGAPHSARRRTGPGAGRRRSARPRRPTARARPRGSPSAARGGRRPARSAPTPAARPGRRRSRHRPSPASGPPAWRWATASTSRAAAPIAVVVTRRWASGSQAWLSAPCWLTTTSGRKAAARSGRSSPDRRQPGALAGVRLERDVDDRPGRRPRPPLASPLPGKRYRPDSWNDTVMTPGIVGVDRLDAVAVVDVEVDVQDPQPAPPSRGDGQRDVVVDAEARGPRRHRVVEAAAGVEGVDDVAAEDRLDRPERAAGHGRGRLVHPGERRHVAERGDPDRPADGPGPRREPRTAAMYSRRVDGRELVVGRRLGREARLGADAPAAGRSPARTGAASAGGPGRSRRSSSAGRRRAAGRRSVTVGPSGGTIRPAPGPGSSYRPGGPRLYHSGRWTPSSSS